jgi:hypothetical protein
MFSERSRPGPQQEGPETRRVAEFLVTYRGLPFCNDCLARECGVTLREARNATERLARMPDFVPSLWWCALCLQRRPVTEARDEQGLIDRMAGGR